MGYTICVLLYYVWTQSQNERMSNIPNVTNAVPMTANQFNTAITKIMVFSEKPIFTCAHSMILVAQSQYAVVLKF